MTLDNNFSQLNHTSAWIRHRIYMQYN